MPKPMTSLAQYVARASDTKRPKRRGAPTEVPTHTHTHIPNTTLTSCNYVTYYIYINHHLVTDYHNNTHAPLC